MRFIRCETIVARRKKTRSKTKGASFKLRAMKKRPKAIRGPSLIGVLKVFGLVCIFVAAGALFYFTEKYVESVKPVEIGPLKLVNVPEWVSEQLKSRIVAAAGGETFRLDEDGAHIVAENLASVAWLDGVNVQITYDGICVEGKWRRPLALVKSGLNKFYVDAGMVALDFVPVPKLPIVGIKGVSVTRMPAIGEVLEREDLAAAVEILASLDRMDRKVVPDKPLLGEIDNIDVSNFNGRENPRLPHIVLYAKDNTQIIWGAEVGAWSQHLEAKDEEKLAKLYNYYIKQGSLLDGVKYINLRDPQDRIPQPIDKY